jgi:TolB-like protein
MDCYVKKIFMLLALVFLFPVSLFAQSAAVDVLYLKDGMVIRGHVIEISAANVKITTAGGSLFVFAMSEIEKMVKETPARAPQTEPVITPDAQVQKTIAPRPISAGAQRVAVMPFENTTKDSSLDWLSMGIPETITNDLLAIKGIALIERLQLRKVMNEQALQLTGAIDEATAIEVGKLTGADVLVVGAFQKQAQMVRLTARFVNVQTGGILQTAKATGTLDDIFNLQDQIVRDLLKNMNIELKQNELEQLAEKPTESLEAYQHFGQGSLLQARKDYQGALEELQKASAADPEFSLVKRKFAEIFLSLNKGNYWTYETTSKSTIIFLKNKETESHGADTYRAGGHELFNGMSVFSYTSGGESQSNGVYTGNIQSRISSFFVKKDEGIYMVGVRSDITTNLGQTLTTMIYEPPCLFYPYDMEVGKKWELNSGLKMEISGMTSLKSTSKQEEKKEVINKETITVPAGTFDCFVIESVSSFQGRNAGLFGGNYSGTTVTTTWFAQGVGTIKTRTETKTKQMTSVAEGVLKEYHIEE